MRAKLKTFVQANGALLAEQEVVEYQQTNYEILRFVHRDASGSGVQQTLANGTLAVPNGRTAEYDAMGRNVADPGPYVTLNTQPPSENGSGIDLFGNGEGYRPGRRTITVNGWPIPESEFSERFSIYAFNFVFAAARMSTYEVGRWYRTTRTPGIETGVRVLDGVDSGSRGWEQEPTEETRLLSIVYNTSWSFTTLIIPAVQQQATQVREQSERSTPTGPCIPGIPCVRDLLREAKEKWPELKKCLLQARANAQKALDELRARLPFDGTWASQVGVGVGLGLGTTWKAGPKAAAGGAIAGGVGAAYPRISERVAGWYQIHWAWDKEIEENCGVSLRNQRFLPRDLRFPY